MKRRSLIKILVTAIAAIMLSSCYKIEYEYYELTYVIEYENEPATLHYSFSGTDKAWAKVYEKEKDKWKWYELVVSPDGGEQTMFVNASTCKMTIISLEEMKIIE